MSKNIPLQLPSTIDENDSSVTNTRRVTLSRNGVAALFAQPSFTNSEPAPTGMVTRPVREYRPPPVARSWLTTTPTKSSTTNNSTRPIGGSSTGQRSSLFRFVIQRSSSFATTAVSQVMSNTTRRQTCKQIRSTCNQHDKLSSIDSDVEPVASITDCLQAPSVAAVQICRSISMPNTAGKYRQHYEHHILVQNGGRPI